MSVETVTAIHNDSETPQQPIQPDTSEEEQREAATTLAEKNRTTKYRTYASSIKHPTVVLDIPTRTPEPDPEKSIRLIEAFEASHGPNTAKNYEELENYAYARLDLFMSTQVNFLPHVYPAQEIAKVGRMRKDEVNEAGRTKREALEDIKEYVLLRGKAQTECVSLLEKMIDLDYDIDPGLLENMLTEFEVLFNLDEKFVKAARNAITAFSETQRRIKEKLERYPDKLQLARNITGYEFPDNTPMEVLRGPMSLDIITTREAAQAYFKIRGYDLSKFTPGAVASANHFNSISTGFSANESPVNFTVNASYGNSYLTNHYTTHERRHILNSLHLYAEGNLKGAGTSLANQMLHPEPDLKLNEEKLQKHIHDVVLPYFRAMRYWPLRETRDELLAIKKDQTSKYESDFWKFDESPYDHGAIRRTEYKRLYPDYSKQVDKVFKDEYREIVQAASKSFDELRKFYPLDTVLAELGDLPLTQWPKRVHRLTRNETLYSEDETKPPKDLSS